MPRELLLPIPHAIADKVHHLLLETADRLIREPSPSGHLCAQGFEFQKLADKLDTLAREAGVIGW